MANLIRFVAVFSAFLVIANGRRLEQYLIDPSQITVSGLSAGGAFAVQFHYAFSRTVSGAGIFAGLPFSCAKGGLTAATQCMSLPLFSPSVSTMLAEARSQATSGKIDPLENLQGQKAYIFHGKSDFTVVLENEKRIREMYEELGVTVESETSFSASHGLPTDHYGVGCGSSAGSTQYLINCNYKGVYEMLNYLHGGDLLEPDYTAPPTGDFYEFDQTEFYSGSPSLDTIGYAYVPEACQNTGTVCKLHIAFHGCLQSRTNSGVGDKFAKNAGYLQTADLNDFVIIYPQAKATLLINPNACFEWWPYSSGANFHNKEGAQMSAVYKMMMRTITGA